VAPDGLAIFTETAAATREDVMAVTLDGNRKVTPLVQSPSRERNGVVSPDGRWLAYESDSSGQFEIWVRPYPAVSSAQWQVTTGGGTRPLWMPRGQELMYIAPNGAVMSVAVSPRAAWEPTTPRLLVKEGYFTNPLDPIRTYDVSPDGQRFLLIKPDASSQQAGAASSSLIVVLNWVEELERIAPFDRQSSSQPSRGNQSDAQHGWPDRETTVGAHRQTFVTTRGNHRQVIVPASSAQPSGGP
jgi:serine/threonine-protein kinase